MLQACEVISTVSTSIVAMVIHFKNPDSSPDHGHDRPSYVPETFCVGNNLHKIGLSREHVDTISICALFK